MQNGLRAQYSSPKSVSKTIIGAMMLSKRKFKRWTSSESIEKPSVLDICSKWGSILRIFHANGKFRLVFHFFSTFAHIIKCCHSLGYHSNSTPTLCPKFHRTIRILLASLFKPIEIIQFSWQREKEKRRDLIAYRNSSFSNCRLWKPILIK